MARPAGGRLADRFGGARVTLVAFGMLVAGAGAALVSVQGRHFGLFFASFLFLFVATGIGNGSTYRMISRIFRIKGEDAGGSPETMLRTPRRPGTTRWPRWRTACGGCRPPTGRTRSPCSAAAAGNRAFGVDRGLPFPLADVGGADAVLLVGSNLAETMPPACLLQVRGQAATLDGHPLPLSPAPMAILRTLPRRPGEVVDRHRLLAALPGAADLHAVEVAVARLRTGLGRRGVVETVVKRGYRLTAGTAPLA